jgi:hypothetical protein
MYFNQGITIFDTTAISNATTGGLVVYGGLSIFNTTMSTGITSGAFVVAGGVGVQGTFNGTAMNLSGILHNTNTAESTTTADGALIVDGGVGIAKDVNIGGDVTIAGDLFVNGTTTSINSTTVNIDDNTFLINSGPGGSRDAGFLIQRFQVDNDLGTGDVVTDTVATSGTFSTGNTTTTVTLPSGFSAVTDFYKFWWIKITSGAAQDEVREITAYDATSKVATLSSALGTAPTDEVDTFNLYSKNYLVHYYDEASDEYRFGFTPNAVDITTNIEDSELANVRLLGLYGTNATVTNVVATNISAGSLTFTDATISNLYVTNSGTINNAYLNDVTAGTLIVNQVPMTPSDGDIPQEHMFTAGNGIAVAAPVTGLAFANTVVRSFDAQVSASILTTADVDNRYALYTLQGVQKITGGWVLNTRFIGDNAGVVFSIDNTGQINYTSTSVGSFISDTIKFKADTTSV